MYICVESGLGPWMEWTERYPSHAYGKTVLGPKENKESYASCTERERSLMRVVCSQRESQRAQKESASGKARESAERDR